MDKYIFTSSGHFPGLLKLLEEMGELQQIAAKGMAVDWKDQNWPGYYDLLQKFGNELADVKAILQFLVEEGEWNKDPSFNSRVERKLAFFRELREDI